MPNSLKSRLKKLKHQGLLSEKDLSRIYTDNDVVEEFKKIKADFVEQRKFFGLTKHDSDYDLGSFDSYNYVITTIDYRIAELKGESNE